jgi:hypothetical protein
MDVRCRQERDSRVSDRHCARRARTSGWRSPSRAVFASALAYYIQTWAQPHIDASRTALIIAMEPAWAVAAAVVLAGQTLGLFQGAGATLVLAAIVGHELAPLKFKAPEHEPIET